MKISFLEGTICSFLINAQTSFWSGGVPWKNEPVFHFPLFKVTIKVLFISSAQMIWLSCSDFIIVLKKSKIDQKCRFVDWGKRGLEGEKAIASDYIILLPLPALEPDPITTYHEGTMQSNTEAGVGEQVHNSSELKGEGMDARTRHSSIQAHRTHVSRTCRSKSTYPF